VGGAVDLHSHTTASDGSLVPRELVRLADELDAIPLAHDGVRGSARVHGRSVDVIDLYLPAAQ